MQIAGDVWFFLIALCFRLVTFFISVRHERKLKAEGAVEFGKANSTVLALLHILFYFFALLEALHNPHAPDLLTWIGVGLYLVGAVLLLMVMRILGRLWTVKLFIAKDHVLIQHPLFVRFTHPNYFLALLPELVGLALALHAFRTLAVGLPLYLISLGVRIRQEQSAMEAAFPAYEQGFGQ